MLKKYHTFFASPLGTVQVSCNNDCITRVHFLQEADRPSAPDDLQTGAPPVLQLCVYELKAYFQGQGRKFEVPICQEGTVFQQRVWNELLNIPYGKTISYLTLSKRLGDPAAIRAAAATNGKNDIAVIVPCHRVIGSNNDLVGYAGGLWRKKWLLELEAKITWGVQTLF
ncbi:MAG: methylated-DNA--[protein]-cysteine S-methyltransferase [Bacteroidota bacterium]